MKNKKFLSKKIWIPVLVGVLLLQTLALLVIWMRVDGLWFQISNDSNHAFRQLVGQSARAHFVGAVVDPVNERVYMPELKVYVPYSTVSRSLEYEYTEAHEGSVESAFFSTDSVLERPVTEVGQNVCTNVARVEVANQANPEDFETVAGRVQLKDGRILQVYARKTGNCSPVWNSDSTPEVVSKLLIQAQSY